MANWCLSNKVPSKKNIPIHTIPWLPEISFQWPQTRTCQTSCLVVNAANLLMRQSHTCLCPVQGRHKKNVVEKQQHFSIVLGVVWSPKTFQIKQLAIVRGHLLDQPSLKTFMVLKDARIENHWSLLHALWLVTLVLHPTSSFWGLHHIRLKSNKSKEWKWIHNYSCYSFMWVILSTFRLIGQSFKENDAATLNSDVCLAKYL